MGALGFSLSHVEKKSSVSRVGVAAASGVSSRPSMWMPWGFLRRVSESASQRLGRKSKSRETGAVDSDVASSRP